MAITLVQGPVLGNFSFTPSFASNTTAGNCVIVVIAASNGGGGSGVIPSITGVTLGGSADNFTQAVSSTTGSSGGNILENAIWIDLNCAGGQKAISVSGSNLNAGGAIIYEFSGLTSVDQISGSNSGTGTATSWSSNSTPATTAAAELWVGGVYGFGSPGAHQPGAPWINTNTSNQGVGAGYQITSSTGSAVYSGTQSNAQWAAVVATLKGPVPPVAGTAPVHLVVSRRSTARSFVKGFISRTVNAIPPNGTVPPKPVIARRTPARAVWTGTVSRTTNAIPPNGTVQPKPVIARRTPARAVWTGTVARTVNNTIAAVSATVPHLVIARRSVTRGMWRGTLVSTTNAPPPPPPPITWRLGQPCTQWQLGQPYVQWQLGEPYIA